MTLVSRIQSRPAPKRASTARFNPDQYDKLLANFKARLNKEVETPQQLSDLTTFAFDIRRLITGNADTKWLLSPVKSTQGPRYRASMQYASIIKAALPPYPFGEFPWPNTTFEMLDMMQRLAPDPWDQYPKSPQFPKRHKRETLSAYFARFKHWVAYFMPEAIAHPVLVRRLATLVWGAHYQLYDLSDSDLAESFKKQRPEFRTFDDVTTWFQQQPGFRPALAPVTTPSQRTFRRMRRTVASQEGSSVPQFGDSSNVNTEKHGSPSMRSASSSEEGRESPIKSPSFEPTDSGECFWDTFKTALLDPTNEHPAQTTAVTPSKTAVEKGPKSYAQAMNHPDAKRWKNACYAAMRMIRERKVWELVEMPQKAYLLSSRWILRKYSSDTGRASKYGAQLVVDGFKQRYGKDYYETDAEAATTDVLRLVLAVAARYDWCIESVRVKFALAYGDLEHVIYMQQPEGFDDGTGRVCRLTKSLPGLKQASRQWFTKLVAVLKGFHFEKVADAPGLFVRTMNQMKTCILVNAGELLIVSSAEREMQRVKSLIGNAFDIVPLGFPESYLSLHIEKTASGLAFGARNIMTKVLDNHRDLFSSYVLKGTTPILLSDAKKAVRLSTDPENHAPLDTDAEPLSAGEVKRYRSAVGSLITIATNCRPDIYFAVSQLQQYMKEPNKLHWRMLMRVLTYLDVTQEARLTYGKQKAPRLVGYSAASFSGEYVKVPHGGYLWFYGSSLLSWSSRCERGACRSEASSRCTSNAFEYGEWARTLLVNLGALDSAGQSYLYTDLPLSMSTNSAVVYDEHAAHPVSVDRQKASKIEVKNWGDPEGAIAGFAKPLSAPPLEEDSTSV